MDKKFSLISQKIRRKFKEIVSTWMILVLQTLFITFIVYCAAKKRAANHQSSFESSESPIRSNNVFKEDLNITEEALRTFTLSTTKSTTTTKRPKTAHKLNYFLHRDLFTTADIHNLPLFGKEDLNDDRILNQLLYVPKGYDANCIPPAKYKKISLFEGLNKDYYPKAILGTKDFKSCLVSTCTITKEHKKADLVLWHSTSPPAKRFLMGQIWVAYSHDSPFTDGNLTGSFNWTATYRRDSDIVSAFGKWEYYDSRVRQVNQEVIYAEGKTKKVVWYLSNCKSFNNRMEIANALQKFIPVDIYGKCTNRSLTFPSQTEFFKMLRNDYKFYLAFETANCEDFISYEVFETALKHDVIPIVMGGTIEEYSKYLPEKSFIHVDDFESIESLGNYLNLLDKDETLYNSYFKWRGTGEFINTKFWCRLCAILHVPEPDVDTYSLANMSFKEWWEGEGTCRENKSIEKKISEEEKWR